MGITSFTRRVVPRPDSIVEVEILFHGQRTRLRVQPKQPGVSSPAREPGFLVFRVDLPRDVVGGLWPDVRVRYDAAEDGRLLVVAGPRGSLGVPRIYRCQNRQDIQANIVTYMWPGKASPI